MKDKNNLLGKFLGIGGVFIAIAGIYLIKNYMPTIIQENFRLSCRNWGIWAIVLILFLMLFIWLAKLIIQWSQKAKSEAKKEWQKQSYLLVIKITIMELGIYGILVIFIICLFLLFGLICGLKTFV